MFFSSDLLIFKRGKFNLIWLAATRGEKFLTKKQIKMVDIHFACSEVMEYILLHQKIKLSLYLSSQLTFGLCVIYHKKIDKLLNDLQDLYKKSLLTFTLNLQYDRNKGAKKGKSKNDFSISILDEFGEVNGSFGMLNQLDKNLVLTEYDLDLTNQVAYLNQARFEDITLMEYDAGHNNLRNQLDNDLEPMNAELLQELLAVTDPCKNDIASYLNIPFDVHEEIKNHHENQIGNVIDRDEVDLDRTLIYNEVNDQPNAYVGESTSIIVNKTDKEFNVGMLEKSNLVPEINVQIQEDVTAVPSKVKVSCVIDEVEVDQKSINDANAIVLNYRKRKINKNVNAPKSLKRKPNMKSLIIDTVTTISHQVIRENMSKKTFGLIDKNALFPNPYVAKSLRAQIACSTNNLFEFPGNYTTLICSKHLRLWMDRKTICQNSKSQFIEYDDLPTAKPLPKDKTLLDFSDLSIEKARGASSFTNYPIDSFTMGSDSFQRSNRQSSFDADRTYDENNKFIPEIVDEAPNYSTDKSMLPIIEEDFIQKQDLYDQKEIHYDKVIEKGDVWRIIQQSFKSQLDVHSLWDEIRVPFTDICNRNSTRKTAAMVFLTLLRLGKYGKIRIFQETSLSDIFIGLPKREI